MRRRLGIAWVALVAFALDAAAASAAQGQKSIDPQKAADDAKKLLLSIAVAIAAVGAAYGVLPRLFDRKHQELIRTLGIIVVVVGVLGGAVVGLANGFWAHL